MSVTKDIIEHLESSDIEHQIFTHDASSSSEESAQARKEAGAGDTIGAKALLLKNKRGEFAICVISGVLKLDSKAIRGEFGKFKFATPEEMGDVTKGLSPGTIPPFGSSIFPKVEYFLVDESLEAEPALGFNAGCHNTSVVLSGASYFSVARLDDPIVGKFSTD